MKWLESAGQSPTEAGNLAMYHLCRTAIDRFHENAWRRLEAMTNAQPQQPAQRPAPVTDRREPWIPDRDWFNRRSR